MVVKCCFQGGSQHSKSRLAIYFFNDTMFFCPDDRKILDRDVILFVGTERVMKECFIGVHF